MRLRVSVDFWAARILAVLAVAPTAGCDEPTTTTTKPPPGGTGAPFACEEAEPILVADEETGYVQCKGGWLHREQVVTCPSRVPRAEACTAPDGQAQGQCTTDADCTERPHGFCTAESIDFPGCYCRYGCTADADCSEGQVCLCADPIGECVVASCTTDADCGSLLCSTYVTQPGCGGTGLACQTPLDACASNADCSQGQECSLEALRHVCSDPNCAIGRPFLVDGVTRVAELAARDDWRGGRSGRGARDSEGPALAELSEELRGALAAHWARAALLEHASVAAFARFALQLLSMGAPPDLVVAAQAAMADEIEHARLCFELASAYGGRSIGPGPLDVGGALGDGSAVGALVAAIREGCVGETLAAIEAAEAARHATDPAVQRVLLTIAEDETRHAELAWRFVAWAIYRDSALRSAAEAEFAAAADDALSGADAAPDIGGSLQHGVLDAGHRRELRRRAVSDVIARCARATLATLQRTGLGVTVSV